jgi:hypothetical protein
MERGWIEVCGGRQGKGLGGGFIRLGEGVDRGVWRTGWYRVWGVGWGWIEVCGGTVGHRGWGWGWVGLGEGVGRGVCGGVGEGRGWVEVCVGGWGRGGEGVVRGVWGRVGWGKRWVGGSACGNLNGSINLAPKFCNPVSVT